ncbi:MAG: ribonuclease PH [Alphaproteobacteria bacterium]|nr:ribonuclease PH [Alphaproteobacteria bacterium]
MRQNNRAYNELRKIEIIPDVNAYAEGSCLIKCGNTHVLCTATVDDKLPAWLKGGEKGWITAEYALLPRSTRIRVSRETKGPSGRTHEIQRLIGRSLRAVTDLNALKDYIINIDCDVLQADGGTRTASITGSFVALYIALQKMVRDGKIACNPIKEFVAAVSCGLHGDEVLLDLDYDEDSSARADTNFVLTESGKIVEVQGTAEGEPFDKEQFETLFALAQNAIADLIKLQKQALGVK